MAKIKITRALLDAIGKTAIDVVVQEDIPRNLNDRELQIYCILRAANILNLGNYDLKSVKEGVKI